jgi:ankyrin repeat protein
MVVDWPGHREHGPELLALLVAAGADVNAAFGGPEHDETPLHWAASNDDVAMVDALLDAGADIDAPARGARRDAVVSRRVRARPADRRG